MEDIKQIRVAPKGVGHAGEKVERGTGSCWQEVIRGRRGGRSWNLGLGPDTFSYETFWQKTSPLVSEYAGASLGGRGRPDARLREGPSRPGWMPMALA